MVYIMFSLSVFFPKIEFTSNPCVLCVCPQRSTTPAAATGSDKKPNCIEVIDLDEQPERYGTADKEGEEGEGEEDLDGFIVYGHDDDADSQTGLYQTELAGRSLLSLSLPLWALCFLLKTDTY